MASKNRNEYLKFKKDLGNALTNMRKYILNDKNIREVRIDIAPDYFIENYFPYKSHAKVGKNITIQIKYKAAI